MYCPKCGQKIEEDTRFCPFCGTRIQTEQREETSSAGQQQAGRVQDTSQNPASGTGYGAQPGGYSAQPGGYSAQPGGYSAQPEGYGAQPGEVKTRPVNFYYQRQFDAIAQGEPSRFNWAAFFLGPFHALYRGHTKRFLTLYLPQLLLMVADQIALLASIKERNLALMGAAGIFGVVLGLAGLCIAIYNGITFNQSYAKHCGGDPRVACHGGRVVVLILLEVLVSAALMVGFFLIAISRLLPSDHSFDPSFEVMPSDSEILQEPQSSGSQEKMEELLAAYADIPADQLYLMGWCDPDATAEEVRLDSVYLFRSDEILLTDVLTAACQNWFWETVEPEESFFEGDPLYYLIYCTLDEGEICFEVATGGGNVQILGCYLWQGEEYVGLDQQQASALLENIYERAGAPQSIAFEARGSWRTSDGVEFVMDKDTINGQPYTLWFMREGGLAVYLDDVEGVQGEYFMMLDDGILNVWQYDEEDNIINDLYYSKVD